MIGRTSEQGRSTCRGKRPGALLPARGRNGDKAELLSEGDATGLNAELKRRSSASRNTWTEKCGGLDPKPGAGIQHQERCSHPTLAVLAEHLGFPDVSLHGFMVPRLWAGIPSRK